MPSVKGNKYVIFGASGLCGKAVVPAFLEAGASVRALCRDPAKLGITHEKLEIVKGDLTDAATVKAAIKGCAAVICLAGGPQDRAFHGGFLLPLTKVIIEGMAEHGVQRLVMQLGALANAPVSMMPNEELSNGFLKRVIFNQIVGAYFSVFHGCHVDNQLVVEYFAGLEALVNQKLKWTLTRPTGIEEPEAKGKVVSAEHLILPSENGMCAADFGQYYIDLVSDDTDKWVHKSPFMRYERPDGSDVPPTTASGWC
mmetsp:Transcript_2794/g.5417  ORF Transcript_2794/g.5417 Transcript_2794/m.5417 type:complete len:255 (-) Transcript_2794:83-847(-)